MITASVGVDSSLLLEPARELQFPLPDVTSGHRPRCCLTLTNLSPLNDVLFRVRTRNPDAFTVCPTHGLLAPGTSSQVVMTATARTCERLGAMDPRDLMTRQSSELFVVQSMEREKEVQTMQPLDPDSSSSLRAFWKQMPRDCVTENKLVCRFTAGIPALATKVTQDPNMFSRSLSNTSMNSQEYRSSRGENRSLSMSAHEFRSSRSGSNSEFSRLNRSLSNQLTPPPEMHRNERWSRNQSFGSDASFHTTIEPPIVNRRSEARMSTSSNWAASRTPTTRLRDSALTSISVSDGSVSDTMLSAQTSFSTDAATEEQTHELGPLQYHIQPSDVLSFNLKRAPRFWGQTSLFVVNSSQHDCLAFKVRTSNQSGYVVKPSRGLVSTTNAQEVIVSLCAPRDENSFDPAKREAKDGFMIEVANISRDKYEGLMRLDERKRTREMSSLWSLMPRSDRRSTMLSVELKTGGSDCGSGTCDSSDSGNSDARSTVNRSSPEKSRQSLHSVVRGMKQLSTSSSTDESPESVAEEKPGSAYDSDESAFTVAPSVALSEVGKDESGSDADVAFSSAAKSLPRDPAVIVVSADRMDTVDFSNPKLSFFI
ncbi:hypothetical protein PRNP1_007046 [Phytophthora ramorum]